MAGRGIGAISFSIFLALLCHSEAPLCHSERTAEIATGMNALAMTDHVGRQASHLWRQACRLGRNDRRGGLSFLLVAAGSGAGPALTCDGDSDCYYVPANVLALGSGKRVPALVILSCTGARSIDLDTCRQIGDSLGWILASCHGSRNHRASDSNDLDIGRTIGKLRANPRVDTQRVFLFGFSGQGVQALWTMFRHPELVRGVIATCAHAGALPLAAWDRLIGHCVYLITREKDWNRQDNELMHELFNANLLEARLVVTAGEHSPGPCQEILEGCRWLERVSR